MTINIAIPASGTWATEENVGKMIMAKESTENPSVSMDGDPFFVLTPRYGIYMQKPSIEPMKSLIDWAVKASDEDFPPKLSWRKKIKRLFSFLTTKMKRK